MMLIRRLGRAGGGRGGLLDTFFLLMMRGVLVEG